MIQSAVLKEIYVETHRHLSSVTVFSSDLTATVTKKRSEVRLIWHQDDDKRSKIQSSKHISLKMCVCLSSHEAQSKGPGLRCAVENNGSLRMSFSFYQLFNGGDASLKGKKKNIRTTTETTTTHFTPLETSRALQLASQLAGHGL